MTPCVPTDIRERTINEATYLFVARGRQRLTAGKGTGIIILTFHVPPADGPES
jgi:hypothetical protein